MQDLTGSVVESERHDPEARIHVAAASGNAGMTVRALRFDTDEGVAQRLHAVPVLEVV